VKRKKEPQPSIASGETVVADEILQQAKLALDSERPRKPVPCVVCAGECSPGASEGLCWVCRRLKLSAWRDSDSQMPVQE
jgi:hypothetical protein